MLALTRKVNEVICIGDNIEVMVISVKGNKVKLGIKTPSFVSVDRKEVREDKENGIRHD